MPTVRSAADLGAAIRAGRRARGLTQAELATRAAVGRQWLVAVERGHERAEVGRVGAVLAALDLDLAIRPMAGGSAIVDLAHALRAEVEGGDTDFALRLLAQELEHLDSTLRRGEAAIALEEPPSTSDHRWDTLLAAAIGWRCRLADRVAPRWTNVGGLDTWWFPIFDPLLVARTMQRTPIDFAARGIWLDAKALLVA